MTPNYTRDPFDERGEESFVIPKTDYEAGYDEGREKMREDVRSWLASKSAGTTPVRLLEDLDREVPL